MRKIIEYVYNRVYHILSSLDEDSEKNNKHIIAWLFCSIITTFFIFDIVLFLTNSKKIFIMSDGLFFLLTFLIVALFYYFFTLLERKYIVILESYINEGKKSIWFGNICVLIFSFTTIILFIVKSTRL